MADSSLEFSIQPSSGVPIYRQIMDQVRALAASGQIRPGDMLPSIRQLAQDLEVNMMTVSKAYAKLEADDVLERVRGTGMRLRVTQTYRDLADREAELQPLVEAMLARGLQLGLTQTQIISLVRKALKERQSWIKPSSTSVS